MSLLKTYAGQRWHDYWYGKEGTGVAGSQAAVVQPRVFGDGPLRELRVGATVNFANCVANFILAQQAGAVFVPPSESLRVLMYGTVRDDSNMISHYFHLGLPSVDTKYILEVVTQNDTILDDCSRLYQLADEICPASAEEWDEWLSGDVETTPILGGINLTWNDADYGRVWGIDSAGVGSAAVDPVVQTESVRNPDGSIHRTNRSSMLYGRMLGTDHPIPEYVLLSMVRDSLGGTESRWIEAYVGLAIQANEINAL